jgi:hypothetical protein
VGDVMRDGDWQHLTAFYDFPAEHWRHLHTSNAIESSFATVKLRTRVTKGAASKKAALAMAYKLLDAEQERWRRFNGHVLVTDVLAGVKFKDGIKGHRRRQRDDGREGRRLMFFIASSTTLDNCSGQFERLLWPEHDGRGEPRRRVHSRLRSGPCITFTASHRPNGARAPRTSDTRSSR